MTTDYFKVSAFLLIALDLLVCPLLRCQQRDSSAPLASRSSGEIRGTIIISGKGEGAHEHIPRALMERYGSHGASELSMRMSAVAAMAPKLSERAVVFLESDSLDRGTYVVPKRNPSLDQKDLQFHPQVLPILVGTTVDFPNRDNLFHNVFSYSEPKDFDLGRYPRNDSRSVKFDKQGTVRVYCDIHSHMNATILVFKHPYFSISDDNGAFVIRDVPEGKYRIVLWYDRDIAERRIVEVRAGEVITVDFTF